MERHLGHTRALHKKGVFRLEFSEGQQQFHLDRGTHAEYTHGWRTICQCGEDSYLSAFIDYMDSKYNRNSSKPKKMKLLAVMADFYEYKVIIELYERRKSIHVVTVEELTIKELQP